MMDDGRYPQDQDEEAAFDAFLDDLVSGRGEHASERGSRSPDLSLIESTRRFHTHARSDRESALAPELRAAIKGEVMGQHRIAASTPSQQHLAAAPGHHTTLDPKANAPGVSPSSRFRASLPSLAAVAMLLLTIGVTAVAYRIGSRQDPSPTEAILAAVSPGADVTDGCTIAPRSTAEIVMLDGTPTTRTLLPTPAFLPAGLEGTPDVTLAGGTPADDTVIAGIRQTMDEFAACQNAGDGDRLLALYSDDYFRRAYQAGWRSARGAAIATSVTEIGDRLPVPPSVANVEILPDGRVAATVTFRYREATRYTPAEQAVMMIFRQVESRWLIDEGALVPPMKGAASPTAAVDSAFIVPVANGCTMEPRSFASLMAVAATPAAGTPAALGDTALSGTGEVADTKTTVGITATVREIYGCFAASEEFRAYALYTDGFLIPLIQRDLSAPKNVVASFGPHEAFRLIEAHILPDGRVSAAIAFRVSEGVFAETWVFKRQGGRFLLDGVAFQPMIQGTPAA